MNQNQFDNFGEPNYTSFVQGDNSPTKTVDLVGQARASFVRKVYSVLCVQLLITVMMTALSMTSPAFFLFQLMFCCQGGRTFPENFCLGLFTLAEAYVVSFMCSETGMQSGNHVVLLAGVYTLVIVLACTLYAANTESDFTTSNGIFVVLGAALMVLFIATLFTSSPFIENLYCCVGVILFGIYLVVDTQMILGGKSIELSVDDYALGAMLLYIDIIQIFLYILRLLSNKD